MSMFKKIIENNESKKNGNSNVNIKVSESPGYIDSANKIFRKEYDSAINDLQEQLKHTDPNNIEMLAMIHINLMQVYYKDRAKKEEYFALSTQHGKKALIYGHNTGLAAYRVIVNLEKEKKFKQAIEVCEIVTNKEYHFSKFGYKQKPEFQERLEKLKLKFNKFGDDNSDSFLTEEEKKQILKNSKLRQ